MNTSESLSFLLHDNHASHLTSDAMRSLNELAAAMLSRQMLEDSLDQLDPLGSEDRLKIERLKRSATESSYMD